MWSGHLKMASSFPTARFPIALSKEKAAAEPIYRDEPAKTDELSDETLVAQISAGDQEALALLFRRYARLVWSVADRIVRNQAEADDLLQDVFLLIQRRACVFDSSKGTARSLIVHMTYQRALSRRRYLNARHCQALNDLSEDQRKTLRLYFFEGYSVDEIASRLGQSVGSVKHHYYRGLARLRRCLPKG